MTVGSSLNITTGESQWRHVDEKRPIHADFNPDSPSICVPAFHPVNRTIWNVGSRLFVGSLGTASSVRRYNHDCYPCVLYSSKKSYAGSPSHGGPWGIVVKGRNCPC